MQDFFDQIKTLLLSEGVYCNSILHVYLFRVFFPELTSCIRDGFLNVQTNNDVDSFSIRHYYFVIDSITYDPIVFVKSTQDIIESRSITSEPMYSRVYLENEELREYFFKNTDVNSYFRMCHSKCFYVLESLIRIRDARHLTLNVNRRIVVNERCPCNSGKKYKKCHYGIVI